MLPAVAIAASWEIAPPETFNGSALAIQSSTGQDTKKLRLYIDVIGASTHSRNWS
jgi:hypothetical protein